MANEILFNAFDMNCVGHQSCGLWRHPRDRSAEYTSMKYWQDLARTLERGLFDGIFLADVTGIYDVYNNSPDAALRSASQVPTNDPFTLVPVRTNHNNRREAGIRGKPSPSNNRFVPTQPWLPTQDSVSLKQEVSKLENGLI